MEIGGDTHKRTHVLVALDDEGRQLGTKTVFNTPPRKVGPRHWPGREGNNNNTGAGASRMAGRWARASPSSCSRRARRRCGR